MLDDYEFQRGEVCHLQREGDVGLVELRREVFEVRYILEVDVDRVR